MPNSEVYTNDLLDQKNLIRLAKQKAVIDLLKRLHEEEKTALRDALQEGQSIKIANDLGLPLGSVSMSNPQGKLVIESLDHALIDFEDRDLEFDFADFKRDREEILAVLETHAPHLLTLVPTQESFESVSQKILKEYQRTGDLPKGWAIERNKPVLTMRITKNTQEIARDLLGELGVPVLDDLKKKALEKGEK